jgi:hypothetical protein
MRRTLIVPGLAALLALFTVAPTAANHRAGATYRGSAASGGSVSFKVSANGRNITRISLRNVRTDCGTTSSTTTGRIRIRNHRFNYNSGSLDFNGSFSPGNRARGRLSTTIFGIPSCTSSKVRWNARVR